MGVEVAMLTAPPANPKSAISEKVSARRCSQCSNIVPTSLALARHCSQCPQCTAPVYIFFSFGGDAVLLKQFFCVKPTIETLVKPVCSRFFVSLKNLAQKEPF